VGWPVAAGGSQRIADALAGCLTALGGEIRCGNRIRSIEEIPKARAVLFDVGPRQLAAIAPQWFPGAYLERLQRHPHGPGIFKIDWALSEPIPWTARECLRAATVHLGGTLEEIAEGERAVWQGHCPERPFVLLAQQSLFDPSRTPAGKETAWGYCHVPNNTRFDMAARIESQIERFAPGFRDCILARSVWPPARLEEHNPNYVGGDILGGRQQIARLYLRPLGRWRAYRTPAERIFICSSSMPPGAGVHGMCGYYAARAALKAVFQAR
jgi:phytoene dehydrogenase-like protein